MALTMPKASGPFVPSDADSELAQSSSRLLGRWLKAKGEQPVRVRLLDGDTDEPVVTLPSSAIHLLLRVLTEMASGNAVTLVPHHAELTTQQPADMLNVSRPYLVKLLEEGAIPFHKVGTHRRLYFRDAMAHKERVDSARETSLDELAALGQELNLDEPPSGTEE